MSDHEHDHHHGHAHAPADPAMLSSERGIWAVKWSFAGLFATALLQAFVVAATGSVALLADTVHNLGDAFTAVPLWAAFTLSRRPATKRFTYGLGRAEDLAGLAVVFIILASALATGYEVLDRLLHPRPLSRLWLVGAASVAGFIGNEAVALFRIRIGKEIGSAALVADGYHARADGYSSLGVLVGAAGVWLGLPWADPAAGVIITAMILKIAWDSGREVFVRMLDGVDPEVVDEVRQAAKSAAGVEDVAEVRIRWLGHRMRAELNVAVKGGLSVEQGHAVAEEVRHQLLHHLKYLSNAIVHVDPLHASGERHHHIPSHSHDDLPAHGHEV